MLIQQAAQQYREEDRERFIEYVRNEPMAAAQLRAPLYEDKVVDFLFDKADVTEREVTKEELEAAIEADEEAEEAAAKKASKKKAPAKKKAAPKKEAAKKAEADKASIVQMHESVQRPEMLIGSTYKIKTPMSEHAMYVTINDMLLNEGTEHEVRRPFEIFINSKSMDQFQWVVALTRVISAVFRKGGDCTFLAEELKAVFDPRGGTWMGGKYIPSILAAIGGVIEQHMIAIGFLEGEGMGLKSDPQAQVVNLDAPRGKACPSCGQYDMRMVEGCMTCRSCGHSKCG